MKTIYLLCCLNTAKYDVLKFSCCFEKLRKRQENYFLFQNVQQDFHIFIQRFIFCLNYYVELLCSDISHAVVLLWVLHI